MNPRTTTIAIEYISRSPYVIVQAVVELRLSEVEIYVIGTLHGVKICTKMTIV